MADARAALDAEIRALEAQRAAAAAKRDMHRARAELHRLSAGLRLSQCMLLKAVRSGERDPLFLRALVGTCLSAARKRREARRRWAEGSHGEG